MYLTTQTSSSYKISPIKPPPHAPKTIINILQQTHPPVFLENIPLNWFTKQNLKSITKSSIIDHYMNTNYHFVQLQISIKHKGQPPIKCGASEKLCPSILNLINILIAQSIVSPTEPLKKNQFK